MGLAGSDSLAVAAPASAGAWRDARWLRAVRLDLAADLRREPGSARWWRGLARLAVLAAPALACLPGLVPYDATPLPLPDEAALHEFAALAIRPLGAGATTGRHFAAGARVSRVDAVPERATITLDAVYGENDDLGRMLQRLGLGARDADAVHALAAPLGGSDGIAPGTHFAVTLGPRAVLGEPRPLSALAFRPRFDLDVTIARQGGALVLQRHPIPVDATPLHLVGAVGTSLYRSARAAGADPATVQAFLQAVDQYMPFETILPDDRFELVVEHRRALDGTANGAGIDGNLIFAGIVRDGHPLLQIMRWGEEGNFYTAEALADAASESASGLLAAPVAGNITSWFGLRRHPILGTVRLHAGVDFAAPYGAPIYAASEGVVSYAGWHGGHGNYVRLAHGGGIDTGYGHMSRIAVAPGSHVRRGEVLGYVGSTGLSTGPHLHYELYRNGQPVDPLSLRFVPHHVAANPHELAAFRARMAQVLAIRPLAG